MFEAGEEGLLKSVFFRVFADFGVGSLSVSAVTHISESLLVVNIYIGLMIKL